ncbi:MAG: DUF423 domain-containing protein, partial [Thermoanaerobaculia bacterium]|nr:DUF423 domain-containing protein [Thermoanaerobaculia bacterium]
LWETGARYLAYAGLAGQLRHRQAGGTLFALTLFGLALGAPRSLGAVTPLGGAAMIAGLVLFALAVLRGASG